MLGVMGLQLAKLEAVGEQPSIKHYTGKAFHKI